MRRRGNLTNSPRGPRGPRGPSPEPARPAGAAIPVALWHSGLAPGWVPSGPGGPDPKGLQPGVLSGELVNAKDSRGGDMGEAWPWVAAVPGGDGGGACSF